MRKILFTACLMAFVALASKAETNVESWPAESWPGTEVASWPAESWPGTEVASWPTESWPQA